jgi:hypothetical protein
VLALQEKGEALGMMAVEHTKWPTCLKGTTAPDHHTIQNVQLKTKDYSEQYDSGRVTRSAPTIRDKALSDTGLGSKAFITFYFSPRQIIRRA